jgi:hypothetical protein
VISEWFKANERRSINILEDLRHISLEIVYQKATMGSGPSKLGLADPYVSRKDPISSQFIPLE